MTLFKYLGSGGTNGEIKVEWLTDLRFQLENSVIVQVADKVFAMVSRGRGYTFEEYSNLVEGQVCVTTKANPKSSKDLQWVFNLVNIGDEFIFLDCVSRSTDYHHTFLLYTIK